VSVNAAAIIETLQTQHWGVFCLQKNIGLVKDIFPRTCQKLPCYISARTDDNDLLQHEQLCLDFTSLGQLNDCADFTVQRIESLFFHARGKRGKSL
jgi:hypothetical protein